jgi:hypothetical protein
MAREDWRAREGRNTFMGMRRRGKIWWEGGWMDLIKAMGRDWKDVS